MSTGKTGVVMLNMGAPDTDQDVQPYLENIFRDPDIIDVPFGFMLRPLLAKIISRKRAPKSASKYQAIGGSPLNNIAWQQAEALNLALKKKNIDARVRPGMRYWHPFTREALQAWQDESTPDCVIGLSMYPMFSSAVGGSSLKDFRSAMAAHLPETPAVEIASWHDEPFHIDSIEASIRQAVDGDAPDSETTVLLTVHGTPVKLEAAGDPYRKQTEEVVALLQQRFSPDTRIELGYQSQTGPLEWLRPYSDDLVADLAGQGVKKLVIVPVGFVADNMETLWDIERDLMPRAREAGISNVRRGGCPNADPAFIEGLARLVQRSISTRAEVA